MKGDGYKEIAHALNTQHVPAPRPQRGRPAGWDPGTIRAVLRRPIYRGIYVWDRTTKRDQSGERHKGRQPKKDRKLWSRSTSLSGASCRPNSRRGPMTD